MSSLPVPSKFCDYPDHRLPVRVHFQEKADGKWIWKVWDDSSRDGDNIAECNATRGYPTEAAAREAFKRATYAWVVTREV